MKIGLKKILKNMRSNSNFKSFYTKEKLLEAFKSIFSLSDEDNENEINAPRIYLNCPFSEKDECKSLGGKWDPNKKSWYIPDHLDQDRFKKWL